MLCQTCGGLELYCSVYYLKRTAHDTVSNTLFLPLHSDVAVAPLETEIASPLPKSNCFVVTLVIQKLRLEQLPSNRILDAVWRSVCKAVQGSLLNFPVSQNEHHRYGIGRT